MKLDQGQRHLMDLANREANLDGWAKVSKVVWPLIEKIPTELLEKAPSDDGGLVRLTSTGAAILRYT